MDKEENSLWEWKSNVCLPVKLKQQVEETTAEPD